MRSLRKNPHIYEINLMPWLKDLCRKGQQKITLKDIPVSIWSSFKEHGMDLIWLMGMWHRSLDSRKRAQNEPNLKKACWSILADFQMEDIAGSPYAIDRYLPDPAFGSTEDILSLKKRFSDMGLFLILDFVPNHTACDHPWIGQNPEYYIQAGPARTGRCAKGFFLAEDAPGRPCIAHGRDPFFHPWTDTAQINYTHPMAVTAMLDALVDISKYCHGLRCDMAMLILKDVFLRTWHRYLKNNTIGAEFWTFAKDRLRAAGRQSLLIAEVYWGMEQVLIDQGFDYVYDKIFYDLLVKEDIQGLKTHLSAPVEQQERMVRFLENHDEPRAMDVFGAERIWSAMVVHATLPGMRFWHHGQFVGNRIRVPVQLGRGPTEPVRYGLKAFSEKLLLEVDHSVFHDGVWNMCEIEGWPDNPSYRKLLSWCWRKERERRLIVINLSSAPAQGRVKMPVNWLPEGEQFLCLDPIKGDQYLRPTDQVAASGLHVELGKRDYHLFRIEKA